MSSEEIKNIKKGDKVNYDGEDWIVREINDCRITIDSIKHNYSCSNIPLYERRPLNNLTNIEMISR